jgi:hypothetical protein
MDAEVLHPSALTPPCSSQPAIAHGAEDADETSPTAVGRRWWVRGALGALAVLTFIALGLFVSAWRHPSAFPEAGGWGVGARHHKINEPVFVGMTYPDQDAEGTVSIDTVKGHGVTDTADAELAYFVCTIDTDAEGTIGSGSQADVDEFCSTLTPADGASLSLGNHPREQLLLEVTPTSRGVVKIHGLDVTYTLGWQHGTQRIGGEVQVRTVRSQR